MTRTLEVEDWAFVDQLFREPPDWFFRFLVDQGLKAELTRTDKRAIWRRMLNEKRGDAAKEWRIAALRLFQKMPGMDRFAERGKFRATALSWTLLDQKFMDGGGMAEAKTGDENLVLEDFKKQTQSILNGVSISAKSVAEFYSETKFLGRQGLVGKLPADVEWVYHHPMLRGKVPGQYAKPPSSGALALLTYALENKNAFITKVLDLTMKTHDATQGTEEGEALMHGEKSKTDLDAVGRELFGSGE